MTRSRTKRTEKDTSQGRVPGTPRGIVVTHFVVSDDMVGSWRFYTDVPGGKTAIEGEPPLAALASNRIIINTRGGLPTTSQASPSRTSRPRTRWPSSAPRPQPSHPRSPVPASRSPKRRANQAGRWSPHRGRTPGLCTGGDPLELKPRPAQLGGDARGGDSIVDHVLRAAASLPALCRDRPRLREADGSWTCCACPTRALSWTGAAGPGLATQVLWRTWTGRLSSWRSR